MSKKLKNPDDFASECAEIVARAAYDSFICGSEGVFSCEKVESPIEKILWYALDTLKTINFWDNPNNQLFVKIVPQFKVDKYRTDFKLEFYQLGKIAKTVLVECDSQQFHERTESERRYEKARDRYLKIRGLEILHYTGREIMEDPFEIAKEILLYLMDNPFISMDGKAYEDFGITIKV